MSQPKKELLPSISSSAELILLALLSGPSYGAQIMERIDEASGWTVSIGPGNLYPLLRKLERAGLLEVAPSPISELETRGGRHRKYYQLTTAGKDALNLLEQFRSRLRPTQ